jgi:hypothetical protein
MTRSRTVAAGTAVIAFLLIGAKHVVPSAAQEPPPPPIAAEFLTGRAAFTDDVAIEPEKRVFLQSTAVLILEGIRSITNGLVLRRSLGDLARQIEVARDARDRLRRLDAELDEAVARAVELSLRAADVKALNPLGGDVDTVVGELESLRQALEETAGA